MPKRISIVITIALLTLLGILIFKTNKPATESHPTEKDSIQPSQGRKQAPTPSPQKTTSKITPQNSILTNTTISANDRVYRIKDMALDPTTSIGQKNINELITFINTENPYLRDPEAHEPHTVKGMNLKKEASLRVYSLKRLNESLKGGPLESALNQVINKNSDQALVRIAEQILEARKNGEDYFENVRQGVRSLKLPDSSESSQEPSDHHHD